MWSDFYLTNQAADDIEEAVAWHTVGIVGDEPRSIGTGIAVLWHGCSLILTAWHVIKDNPLSDLRFFFRAEGTLRRESPEEAARQGRLHVTPRRSIRVQNLRFDQTNDIAALAVPADLDKSHNLRFYELDRSAVTPVIGTSVVMMGYPHDITLPISNDHNHLFATSLHSLTL